MVCDTQSYHKLMYSYAQSMIESAIKGIIITILVSRICKKAGPDMYQNANTVWLVFALQYAMNPRFTN